MKRLRRAVLAVGLAGLAAPASAVIISSGDGTGNTGAAPGSNAHLYAGRINNLSAVYLGDGWVLTANHVPTGAVTLSGVTHAAVPGTAIRLEHAPGVPTDLKLFRIQTDPGLTTLSISAATPALGSETLLFGNGRNRGAPTTWQGESGFLWAPGNTLRWGTNQVEQTGLDVDLSGSRIRSLVFEFDSGLPTAHEAMAATGDSGGPVFVGSSIAGVLYAISTFQSQPAQTALYGNAALAADLSYYRPAILAVTAERACDDGVDDDGDGAVDLADPGCFAATDAFETNALAPCDDGFDSDGDGLVDWPDDPGCKDLTWLYENPACSDDLDNDGDGKIDYDGGPGGGTPDPHCTTPYRRKETACGIGFELAFVIPVLAQLRRLWRTRA
jgi:hypothetical protein